MEEKLRKYRKKRDFSKTNEPAGRLTASHGPLRFCVQWHDARSRHFDFRLEWEGVAVSWAIPKGPSYDPKDKRLAVRVEDHPVEYMSFEGVIPKGEYGGGTVMLWDEGTWTPKGDPKAGLEAGSLKMTLAGQRLKGDWALVRMKAEEEAWLLLKERDGLEKRTAGVSRFSRSVRTDRTMAEIARAAKRNPFSEANVMLAELSEGLPSDMGWLFEVKYDGHRTLAFCEGGVCALKTRSGLDCTAKFSVAAKGVEEMLKGRAAVLDGEMIVAGKDGVSDFGALQAYAAGRRGDGLAYVLFDLLALDGEDLRARPCIERKERLEALVKGAPPVLAYSRHAESMTAREAERLRARGLEGIVMKRADSPYTAGRTGDWRKWKFRRAEEFVIGGYLPDEAGAVRSLLVGLWEGEALAYAGCVGTGFSEATRRQLAAELKRQERSPFASLPAAYARRAVFVVPAAVAQVAYAELTRAGRLRQASFQGLREDKAPGEVRREQVSRAKSAKRETSTVKSAKRETSGMKETEREKGTFSVMGIRITHPDKTMFEAPMYTKGALAEYYAAVAPVMFPYAKDRPLSLVCCPAGIGGERFFRRHLEGALAGVKVPDGADGDFFLTGPRGILALVQKNAVEFHIQGRTQRGADLLVFDLDPDEGLALTATRRGVRELWRVLRELGLTSFLKTSGGKGYHVVVPLRRTEEETLNNFARRVAVLMEEEFPRLFTANMKKEARAGKIYLDWQRNGPGATSVCPYSVRARAGAPVSMPIRWEDLSRIAPADCTVKDVLRRLKKGSPWPDFFAVKKSQSLQ